MEAQSELSLTAIAVFEWLEGEWSKTNVQY